MTWRTAILRPWATWVLTLHGVAIASPGEEHCESTTTATQLDQQLGRAEAAYAALDPIGFESAVADASSALRCLGELIPAPTAARYHRLEALRQYAIPDDEAATQALRAARVLDSDRGFPDTLLPPNHDLRTRFEGLPSSEGATAPVPSPATGSVYFDGLAGHLRPVERATVFQHVGGGAPHGTHYLLPADPLPAYPVGAARGEGPSRRSARAAMWTLAGASLLGAGATYGLAWSANARFHDPSNTSITVDELQSLRRQTWTLSGVSVGLVVIGAGTAVGGWAAR